MQALNYMVSSFPCQRLIQQAHVPVQKSRSSPPSLETFCMKVSVLSRIKHSLCAGIFFPEPAETRPFLKQGENDPFSPESPHPPDPGLTPLLHVLDQCWYFMFLSWEQKAGRHPPTGVLSPLSLFFPLITFTVLAVPCSLITSQARLL